MKDKEAREALKELGEKLTKGLELERELRCELDKEFSDFKARLERLSIKFCKNCKHDTPQWAAYPAPYWEEDDARPNSLKLNTTGEPSNYTCLVCGKTWKYECRKVVREVK